MKKFILWFLLLLVAIALLLLPVISCGTVAEAEHLKVVKEISEPDEIKEKVGEVGEISRDETKADNGEVTEDYMNVNATEAKELINNNPDLIIIDISDVYKDGHISGAVNYYIGDGSLDNALSALDKEGKYLIYNHTDDASISGAQKLVDSGFKNVYRLAGNFAAWVDIGYEVEKGS